MILRMYVAIDPMTTGTVADKSSWETETAGRDFSYAAAGCSSIGTELSKAGAR